MGSRRTYKVNESLEKWGPGSMSPRTVCERQVSLFLLCSSHSPNPAWPNEIPHLGVGKQWSKSGGKKPLRRDSKWQLPKCGDDSEYEYEPEADRDVCEALRKELNNARKRAEKPERLLQALTEASLPSSESSTKRIIMEYEERVQRAEIAREEVKSQRRAVLDNSSWTQLDRWLQIVELRTLDAREGFGRIVREEEDN